MTDRVDTEVAPRWTRLPRAGLSGLGPDVPPYLHHFEPCEGATHLLLVLTGFPSRPTEPPSAWPLRGRAARLGVHRLFVATPFRPIPEPFVDPPRLAAFLAAARERTGVAPERTICVGSSLGATIALLAAVHEGYGHVIAGAPRVLVGDYLAQVNMPEEWRTALEASMPSLRTREERNGLVTGAVEAVRAPLEIDYYTGAGDFGHPQYTDALQRACAANPLVTLRTVVEPGVDHATMYLPFSRYVRDAVGRILAARSGAQLRSAS